MEPAFNETFLLNVNPDHMLHVVDEFLLELDRTQEIGIEKTIAQTVTAMAYVLNPLVNAIHNPVCVESFLKSKLIFLSDPL